jgi:benzoyl-CoA reductase subunit C
MPDLTTQTLTPPSGTRTAGALEELLASCEALYYDVRLKHIADWKAEDDSRKAVGYLPVYLPRELVIACGVRPVGVRGGGDQINIIRGDSFYQSYICHLPRSVVELGLTSWQDALDGLIFPAICDVIRNLSGVWQTLFPEQFAYYLDLPQEFTAGCGGRFYRRQLEELGSRLSELSGKSFDQDLCLEAIGLYNENRRAIAELASIRTERPEWVPTSEFYLVVRAGDIMEAEEHTALVRQYTRLAVERALPAQDKARILIMGSFCEQPPLNLLKTIEQAGCYVVEEDLTAGHRWLKGDVATDGDPLDALVTAYLDRSMYSSVRYEGDEPKTEQLIRSVRESRASGVLLMSASFCDPSLLDRPHFQKSLDAAGIPYTSLKFAENLGQYQTIREQTGTFAEAIQLWGDTA